MTYIGRVQKARERVERAQAFYDHLRDEALNAAPGEKNNAWSRFRGAQCSLTKAKQSYALMVGEETPLEIDVYAVTMERGGELAF